MSRSAFSVARPRATALRALNYAPEVERIRTVAKSRTSTVLGEIVASFGNNYGKVFTRLDCMPSHGVELLSQSDMFGMEPEGRVIRLDSIPNPDDHQIRRDDVLLAGAGTLGKTELYGRAILADARLTGKYVGPHAMVLRFAEPGSDLAHFVYAFLCTRGGIEAVRSASYGTKVLGLRESMLREIPIPIPEATHVARVAAEIRTAVRERERFSVEIAAARAPIEQLSVMREAHFACAERRVRAGVHAPPLATLGAWNHVSTGAALPTLRRSWHGTVGEVLHSHGIFRGSRFARIPCAAPHGIELLTQRDIYLLRPVPQRVVHPGHDEAVLFAQPGTLLIAGGGTLGEGEIFGRAVFVSERMHRYAVSEDVLRVVPQESHAPVLYAYFSTLVGKRLLRSTAVGTKILRMRPDLLRALPFPEVDSEIAAQVATHLHEAMRARDAAERAEAEAIRLVETEVIPAWLS